MPSSPRSGRDRVIGGLRWALMAVAAVAVLSGWLAATPTGASPDDDYHLTSVWCARGFEDGVCLPNPGGPWDRQTFVPYAVASMSCTAYDAAISAACQDLVLERDAREFTLGIGGNVDGERAGLYYWAMHTFVSTDFARSFLSIRVTNVVVALLLVAATMAAAHPALRRTVALTWLVGMLPLGLFLITSVNTSAWGLAGTSTAWANLLTAISPGSPRRRSTAALLAALGATIALGARTEALAHLLLGAVVVLLLRWATVPGRPSKRPGRTRTIVLALGALAVVGGFAATVIPTPGHLVALARGVGEGASELSERGLGDPWLAVLLEVPQLWAGGLGDRWGLGWLDTPMPALTSVLTVGTFAALVAIGLRGAAPARGTAAFVAVVGLVVLPTVSLVAAGLVVGEQFQPRHYLPALLVLLGSAVLADRRTPGLALGSGARAVFTGGLAIAHAAALHVVIRRYSSGLTQGRTLDLSTDVEWWVAPIPPMSTWLLTSAAFTVLAWLVLGLFIATESDRAAGAQPTSDVAPARPTE